MRVSGNGTLFFRPAEYKAAMQKLRQLSAEVERRESYGNMQHSAWKALAFFKDAVRGDSLDDGKNEVRTIWARAAIDELAKQVMRCGGPTASRKDPGGEDAVTAATRILKAVADREDPEHRTEGWVRRRYGLEAIRKAANYMERGYEAPDTRDIDRQNAYEYRGSAQRNLDTDAKGTYLSGGKEDRKRPTYRERKHGLRRRRKPVAHAHVRKDVNPDSAGSSNPTWGSIFDTDDARSHGMFG